MILKKCSKFKKQSKRLAQNHIILGGMSTNTLDHCCTVSLFYHFLFLFQKESEAKPFMANRFYFIRLRTGFSIQYNVSLSKLFTWSGATDVIEFIQESLLY